MARKSQTKTDDSAEKQEKPTLTEACFIAIANGAESFVQIRAHVLKEQRVIPVGRQDDWPREFDKALLTLVRAGSVAVTNCKYWVHTGKAPKWGQRDAS